MPPNSKFKEKFLSLEKKLWQAIPSTGSLEDPLLHLNQFLTAERLLKMMKIKMMKNAFYLMLKAPFVLKICKCLN